MEANTRTEVIFFDPDQQTKDTLKTFKSFCTRFQLRYEAQFPDPPKTAMDSAIQRWVLEHTTTENPKPVCSVVQYDRMKNEWKERDKVKKVLGMFSSPRTYADWETALPDEQHRNNATWTEFKAAMEVFYRPTENATLNNFQFRSLTQQTNESFLTFCNRVGKEADTCSFTCAHDDCFAESIAVRDQIVIGTTNSKIREEALIKSWDLNTLRTEGMKLESAIRGESEISGGAVNRVGKYSFSKLRKNINTPPSAPSGTNCFNCSEIFSGPPYKHKEICKARNHKCKWCDRVGHFPNMCRTRKVRYTELHSDEAVNDATVDAIDVYNVNIFKVTTSDTTEFKPANENKNRNQEFSVEVVVNGVITSVTADTGAKVSVCGKHEASRWNLLERMVPTSVRIKPYNSPAVPTEGMSRCSVTFGSTSIPVEWFILEGRCEPILSGTAAVNLGIIQFTNVPPIYKPINMINTRMDKAHQEIIQNILAKRSATCSSTLGKHKYYQVRLHIDPKVKPVVTPPRPTPYHLTGRISKAIDEMIANDVIEEHPVGDAAPWISNAVIVPKPNGSLRVTLDSRNINKAIISSNLPIPRQEDIKAKLGGSKVFTRLDFCKAFWQLELQPDSRSVTVFNSNNKLYRYKRLTMGLKCAQGELNAAMMPLFRHINDAHLIHDDVIIASTDIKQHIHAIDEVLASIEQAGLTLNTDKCQFGMEEIKFWGMIVNAGGVQPDPEKVDALVGLEPPKSKDELFSFLCMMQSCSDFIPSFAQKAATLRELTKEKTRFRWEAKHQKCFEDLLSAFRKDILLRYFDPSKPIFLLTDAHITGIGAILAQGDDIATAKPVAVVSRATTDAEKKYPQIDLEGLAVDYALLRFRNYLIGAPNTITVVTDHMPLCSVFNGDRTGSIRTERFKLRNQDIRFKVVYQKGKKNQTDYLSRRATPIKKCSKEEIEHAESLNNLLYTLHTTPIIDKITLKRIAEETANDTTLSKLQEIVKTGKTWIPKHAEEALQNFKTILPEITITGNGILLKGDRIILPESLQTVAIELTHQGSHPGQSSMERRLRYHFYFHQMKAKVKKVHDECVDCNIFTDIKLKEPQKSHQVPDQCWKKVATDLFGPMPSRNHVVVVQDLASRFPVAKLVSSTSADKVIPALSEIYDAYGNPEKQLSDNGPPFNSTAMQKFAKERNIKLEKIPPLHPSSNPAETFMRPLGKTMKIAHHNNQNEKNALQNLLQNYRDTPHPSTGLPPAAMLFRDSMTGAFPRKPISDDQIEAARQYDQEVKARREDSTNSSKYKKASNLSIGDQVLVRNYNKTSKYHPIFSPEQYVVIEVADHGRKLKIERIEDGKTLVRHPDDLKSYTLPPTVEPNDDQNIYCDPDQWKLLDSSEDDTSLDYSRMFYNQQFQPLVNAPVNIRVEDQANAPVNHRDEHQAPALAPQVELLARRSGRKTSVPDRMGVHTYDENPMPGEDDVMDPWWPHFPRDNN